jgi:hypothetical protein
VIDLPGNDRVVQAKKVAAPVVRTATKADEPELLRLLRLMLAEGGLTPLDEDRARRDHVDPWQHRRNIER